MIKHMPLRENLNKFQWNKRVHDCKLSALDVLNFRVGISYSPCGTESMNSLHKKKQHKSKKQKQKNVN